PGSDEEVIVRHEFRLTEELKRAVAKLAFNYFAYIYGSEAALDEAFDPIRAFIRYGDAPPHEIVGLLDDSRLGIVREDGKVPVVHYITVEEDVTRQAILAHVTLFHWAIYRVLLTPNRPETLDRIGSGHLYNIHDRG